MPEDKKAGHIDDEPEKEPEQELVEDLEAPEEVQDEVAGGWTHPPSMFMP